MIETSDLRFRYPGSVFELQLQDIAIGAAETVAIVGPSGSGKTTLLNLVAGLMPPSEGSVHVAGQSLGDLNDRQRRALRIGRIGMVFQNFELLEYLSVLDNILLPLRLSRANRLDGALRSQARELARQLGIGNRLDQYPGQLSQGERQRVAVSRALLLRPPLILADEPTGNLDPSNKGVVLDLLLDYVADCGATLLTVTHDRELLPKFQRVLDIGHLNQWAGDQQ